MRRLAVPPARAVAGVAFGLNCFCFGGVLAGVLLGFTVFNQIEALVGCFAGGVAYIARGYWISQELNGIQKLVSERRPSLSRGPQP